MGAGSSVDLPQDNNPEGRLMANNPVRLSQLHTSTNGSLVNDYDIYRQRGGQEILNSPNAQLQIQATAHWNRIIDHARNNRANSGVILSQRPKCPECVRGNHAGPKCRICGIDVENISSSIAAQEEKINSPMRRISSLGTTTSPPLISPQNSATPILSSVDMLLEAEALKRKRRSNYDESHIIYSKAQLRRKTEAPDSPANVLRNTNKKEFFADKDDELKQTPKIDVEFPDLILQLSSRTSKSITLSWDVDEKAVAVLKTIMDANKILPVYDGNFLLSL
jgi:hypothetical protein